ncbi:MAG: phosphate acyltransferase PlsX [Bacteroidia bacterium]|nr:phosphate acyltransferase PlsX [Bacteroidia bacterium]
MRIGLDIFGGDFAPDATIGGAALALKELPPSVKLVLIGDEADIRSRLAKENADVSALEIVHAPDQIGMGEHPTKAFSQKPNSSIAVGFRLLKEKKLDGFASAGNTGAMLVGSMFSVKTIPGVIRPSITSVLPKENGGFGLILDVGINADCKPDVLYQFGILGSIYAEHVYKIKNPKVALLNIGEEAEKGNLVTQAAHHLMKESKDFCFIGNVEGRDLFNDKADVIVCEGFTGNIVLKEAEAIFTLMAKHKLLNDYFKRFNYENYGGTPILGINSTVIIGHGISNAKTIKNMVKLTYEVAEAGLTGLISKAFQ